MPEQIKHIGTETIGTPPDSETYEAYAHGSKFMELSFFENDNRFELYIQKIEDAQKITNETSTLFAEMAKKMQDKANELNQPVKLFLDPIDKKIEDWAKTKAAEIIGGWDSDSELEKRIFRKTFFPEKI